MVPDAVTHFAVAHVGAAISQSQKHRCCWRKVTPALQLHVNSVMHAIDSSLFHTSVTQKAANAPRVSMGSPSPGCI